MISKNNFHRMRSILACIRSIVYFCVVSSKSCILTVHRCCENYVLIKQLSHWEHQSPFSFSFLFMVIDDLLHRIVICWICFFLFIFLWFVWFVCQLQLDAWHYCSCDLTCVVSHHGKSQYNWNRGISSISNENSDMCQKNNRYNAWFVMWWWPVDDTESIRIYIAFVHNRSQ